MILFICIDADCDMMCEIDKKDLNRKFWVKQRHNIMSKKFWSAVDFPVDFERRQEMVLLKQLRGTHSSANFTTSGTMLDDEGMCWGIPDQ